MEASQSERRGDSDGLVQEQQRQRGRRSGYAEEKQQRREFGRVLRASDSREQAEQSSRSRGTETAPNRLSPIGDPGNATPDPPQVVHRTGIVPSGQRCSRPVRARVNRVIGTASRTFYFSLALFTRYSMQRSLPPGAALAIQYNHMYSDLSGHEERQLNSRCSVALNGESRVLARRHRHRHRRRALQKRVDFTGRWWSLRQRKLI